jgi:hypothetical protein
MNISKSQVHSFRARQMAPVLVEQVIFYFCHGLSLLHVPALWDDFGFIFTVLPGVLGLFFERLLEYKCVFDLTIAHVLGVR